MKHINKKNNHYLKHGQILVFMIIFISTALLISGLAVDVSVLNLQRQKMKKAADAAALAAAYQINNAALADTAAKTYTSANGFTHGTNGVSVQTLINPTGVNSNWVRVTITSPFHFIFGRLAGLDQKNLTVQSTGQFSTSLPLSINLAGAYGVTHPAVCLAIRGHDSSSEGGDPKASQTLSNGEINPMYDPSGYNYKLNVPSNYAASNGTSLLKVDVWDSDSAGVDDGSPDNSDGQGNRTCTTYKIYSPDSTLLGSYTKADSDIGDTNNKWYMPTGWTFDTAVYGTGTYRINVSTTYGSNANGFSFRAGSPAGFVDTNGTSICADNIMCIRFNQTGWTTIQLGYIPSSAAGKNFHINKYDTDIGNTVITYSCSSLAQTWPGVAAANGEWKEDLIVIPDSYSGGTWYAEYYAASRDVSAWEMWYDGASEEDDQSGFSTLVE